MDPTQISGADEPKEAAVAPTHARRIWSTDPIADLALAVAVLVSGGLAHWQFESHVALAQLSTHRAAPMITALLLLWSIAAGIHIARRRHLRILLTGAALIAPSIVQLPLLYLCSEGHCL